MIKLFRKLLAPVAILILSGGIFFLSLPYLVDSFILPEIARRLPFSAKMMGISKISPYSMRGMISLGQGNDETVSVPRFELHYTPQKLLSGTIDTLTFDGALIHLALRDNTLSLYGSPSEPVTTTPKANSFSLVTPFAVQTIIARNCTIILHRDSGGELVFAANVELTLDFSDAANSGKLLTTANGNVQLAGAFPLTSSLKITTNTKGYRVVCKVNSPDITPVATLFPQLKELHLSGQFNANSRLDIQSDLQTIIDYEATIRLPAFKAALNTVALKNRTADAPVQIQLKGDSTKVSFSIDNLHLSTPQQADIDVEGEYDLTAKTFKGSSRLQSALSSSPVEMIFSGGHKEEKTHLNYSLKGGPFLLAEKRFNLNQLKSNGSVDFEKGNIRATLNSHIAEINDRKSGVSLVNVSLNMPMQFAENSIPTKGSFSIEQIRYQDTMSGSVQASLNVSPDTLAFTTLFTTPFIPSLQMSCTGSPTQTASLSVHCNLPKTMVDSTLLPSFLELPEDFTFTGHIAADSSFNVGGTAPEGKLHITLTDGSINFADNQLSDISADLDFPRLPTLETSPSQLCTIGTLEFGKIKMSNARIRFRIENQHALFLEKTEINWSGGMVEAGSLRLSTPFKKLETTFYCDRLNFTELLEQFGVKDTEGQGSLNGKLPIVFSEKGITFDDGFLFSTPGKSGIVRFNNTEQLRQGMPDIAQAAYLDYSLKAMKNFSYNWTRLTFNSEGDDLLIAMQLDGKPAEPLPFGYKNGQIVPQKKGAGLQHPIELDINFRLPLKDLFQYGTNIQSMMENM